MTWRFNPQNAGLTLIELLGVISIGSLLIVALVLLVGRSFQISREQFEQVRITEDARLQIERMAETIRNARPIVCDGQITSWLEQIGEYNLQILTNVDTDADPERVRYFVDTVESANSMLLQQEVTDLDAACAAMGAPSQRILVRSIRNLESPTRALFEYYPWGGSREALPFSGVINTADVGRIGINLEIDISDEAPSEANVFTQVTIRSTECDEEDDCGSGGLCIASNPNPNTLPPPNTPPQCNFNNPNFMTECFYSATTFVQDAFIACEQRCKTDPDLPPGGFCPWSVGLEWDGDAGPLGTVRVSCGCGGGQGLLEGQAPVTIPNTVSVETHDDSYTAYTKACWDGTLCGAGKRGTPRCSLAENACTCGCPS